MKNSRSVRLLSFILFLTMTLMSVFTLASCSDNIMTQTLPGQETTNTEMSQLYVYIYEGGYGSEWFKQLKARFEAAYADVSFEEGKKGVQIMPNYQKSGNTTLDTIINSSSDELYFVELAMIPSLINDGLLLDITDWVNRPLSEFGESRSIYDKMDDAAKAWFSKGGAVYGVPHYESFWGVTYNIDLFEKNLLYFSANPDNGNQGFIKSLDEPRSAGPDGDPSTTYDNGLPATYEDFYRLCERMELLGISPFAWPGKYQQYVNASLAGALMADYEGKSGTELNYTFSGTSDSIVTSVDANGVLTLSSEIITPANGYKVFQQAGNYYALQFLQTIINRGWYSENSFKNIQGQLQAQAEFLYTGIVPGTEKIAFLCDGCWWQTEAKAVFDEMSETYTGADMNSRRFGWLPLPKATQADVGRIGAIVDANWSACFAKSGLSAEKTALAETFFRFAHTDESLREFTRITNTTKGFSYDLTDGDYNALTTFGQSIWDLRKNSDVVRAYSGTDLFRYNSGAFFWGDQWKTTIAGKGTFNLPTNAIRDSGITGLEFFNGMAQYYSKTAWNSKYGAYFD